MKKTVMIVLQLIIWITFAAEADLIVSADTADTYIRYDGDVRFSGGIDARIGQYSVADVEQYQVAVLPFLLPDLAGESISSASLTVEVLSESYFGLSSGQKMNIMGVRVANTSTVIASDQSGGTLVAAEVMDMIDDSSVVGVKTFTEAGLASYLQGIYDTDANAAGKYVFLALTPNTPDSRANSFLTIASADHETATVPTLTLTTVVPEPATIGMLGLGAVVAMLIRQLKK